MKFCVIDTKYNNWWQGYRVAEAINSSLIELGHESCIAENTDGIDEDSVLIVMSIRGLTFKKPWRGKIIAYNFHEVYSEPGKWKKKLKDRLNSNIKIHCWFDYSPLNREVFKRLGYKYIYTPIGYHEKFELDIKKNDYDIGMIGAINIRRNKVVEILSRKYKVFVAKPAEGVTFDGYNEEALGAKLHLHVNRRNLSNFPSPRIMMLCVPNKIPVISEKTDWSPLISGGHHYEVFSNNEELLRIVDRYVRNKSAREQMALRAYSYVRSEYKFIDILRSSLRDSLVLQ